MTISFTTISSEQDYNTLLKSFMVAVEAERFLPYVDSNGVATIGWGFALRNGIAVDGVVDSLLNKALGVNSVSGLSQTARNREAHYYQLLQDALNAPWPPVNTANGGGSTTALQSLLNQILLDRANEINSGTTYSATDKTALGTIYTVFTYDTVGQMQATFDLIKPTN